MRRPLVIAAWVVVVGASALPQVILRELGGLAVTDDARAVIAASVIGLALVVTPGWARLRPLASLFVVLLGLVAAQWLVFRVIAQTPAYHAWLSDPSFTTRVLADQSLRLMVTGLVIAALLVLRRRPARFFLAVGDIHAPMRRLPWLGVTEGTRWSRFGPIAAAAISGGTLVFLLVAGPPTVDLVVRATPFLPVVLLAAAINSFNEEVTYKASLLSVLENPVGPRQALWMVSAYFGIGHYYGVPYGLIGVAMAFALGWLIGRSMLETRGLFWAWFIHFWQDVLIFTFLAIGSVAPGGR